MDTVGDGNKERMLFGVCIISYYCIPCLFLLSCMSLEYMYGSSNSRSYCSQMVAVDETNMSRVSGEKMLRTKKSHGQRQGIHRDILCCSRRSCEGKAFFTQGGLWRNDLGTWRSHLFLLSFSVYVKIWQRSSSKI